MNDKINKLIPTAITAIASYLVKENEDLKVAKEYKGYISSLGASIIQAGLLPTLSFYTDKSKKRKDTDRNNVLKVICYLIDSATSQDLIDYVIINSLSESETLNQNRLNNANNPLSISDSDLDYDKLSDFEDRIMECTIAIKLAFRTFEIIK